MQSYMPGRLWTQLIAFFRCAELRILVALNLASKIDLRHLQILFLGFPYGPHGFFMSFTETGGELHHFTSKFHNGGSHINVRDLSP